MVLFVLPDISYQSLVGHRHRKPDDNSVATNDRPLNGMRRGKLSFIIGALVMLVSCVHSRPGDLADSTSPEKFSPQQINILKKVRSDLVSREDHSYSDTDSKESMYANVLRFQKTATSSSNFDQTFFMVARDSAQLPLYYCYYVAGHKLTYTPCEPYGAVVGYEVGEDNNTLNVYTGGPWQPSDFHTVHIMEFNRQTSKVSNRTRDFAKTPKGEASFKEQFEGLENPDLISIGWSPPFRAELLK